MGACIVVQKLRNRISVVQYSHINHTVRLSNFATYTPFQLLVKLNKEPGSLDGFDVRETIDIKELSYDLSEDSKLKLKKI
jgi:hypothetical protein